MYCPIQGCPTGAYVAVYGFCALVIGAIVAMLGIAEGCAIWNYDPVEMQQAMLREVWNKWRAQKDSAAPAHRFRRAWAIRHLLRPFADLVEMQAEIDRVCRVWSYDSPYNYRRVQ